jgi:LysM repeat protein
MSVASKRSVASSMSEASAVPPEVVIPERARRTMPGGRPQARHLTLVPVPGCGQPAVLRAVDALRPVARPTRFGQSRLDWPLTVPPARPVRLTRRGLAVAVLATVLLAALLLLVARWSAGPSPAAPALPAGSTVTVQPGDTLWSIAQRAEPNSDPRLVVDQLRKANHLNSVVLSPGQTLKVG